MKNKILLLGAVLFALLTLVAVLSSSTKETAVPPSIVTSGETEELNFYTSDEEILSITTNLLNIYRRLYYVTQSEDDNPQTESELVMSMLTETMKDKNEIEKLMAQANELVSHQDEIVSVTAMALYAGLGQLYTSHDNLIKYLRYVDPYSIDLAEFQYQISLFSTENKDAFFNLIEGSSLYPYIFIDFAEEEGAQNSIRISEETQNAIVERVDELFGGIFIEHEQWHKETGNKNAVVLIVQSYKDFLLNSTTEGGLN